MGPNVRIGTFANKFKKSRSAFLTPAACLQLVWYSLLWIRHHIQHNFCDLWCCYKHRANSVVKHFGKKSYAKIFGNIPYNATVNLPIKKVARNLWVIVLLILFPLHCRSTSVLLNFCNTFFCCRQTNGFFSWNLKTSSQWTTQNIEILWKLKELLAKNSRMRSCIFT